MPEAIYLQASVTLPLNILIVSLSLATVVSLYLNNLMYSNCDTTLFYLSLKTFLKITYDYNYIFFDDRDGMPAPAVYVLNIMQICRARKLTTTGYSVANVTYAFMRLVQKNLQLSIYVQAADLTASTDSRVVDMNTALHQCEYEHTV